MESAKICGAVLIAASCIAVIKHTCSGIVPSVRATVGVVLALAVFAGARPIAEYFSQIFESVGFEKYAEPILKGCGVALMTHGCASVCRDSGENSAAEYVELAGRIEIFLLCLPLIEEVLTLARALMEKW